MFALKIAIVCDSPLLKKCLEVFLKEKLASYSSCDFVISDKDIDSEKPVFIIGDDKGVNLRKPFSKSKLLKSVDEYYKKLKQPRTVALVAVKNDAVGLEKQLTEVTERFVSDLLKTIREYR